MDISEIKRALGLPDIRMRRAVVYEKVSNVQPYELAFLIDYLFFSRFARENPGRYVDFVVAIRFDPGLEYSVKRRTYEIMLDRGFDVSAAALLDIPPLYEMVEFPIYELEELPLGLRKAKARSQNKDLLALMCHDHNPQVISVLLQNPLMTQSNVLTVATKRPQRYEVLEEILKNPKWAYRQKVLASIVLNPWNPAGLSCALLPALDISIIKEIAYNKGLHKVVVDAARALLERWYGISL